METIRIRVTANCDQAAELRYTPEGAAYLEAVLVDRDGDRRRWFQLLYFGDQIDALESQLVKGVRLSIWCNVISRPDPASGTRRAPILLLGRTVDVQTPLGLLTPLGSTLRRLDVAG